MNRAFDRDIGPVTERPIPEYILDKTYRIVPFEMLPKVPRVISERYHGKHRKIDWVTYHGFFLNDNGLIFSKDAPYEIIRFYIDRKPKECQEEWKAYLKPGKTIEFHMTFEKDTRSYSAFRICAWPSAESKRSQKIPEFMKNGCTLETREITESVGVTTILYKMMLTPTEYARLYFNYHGSYVWDSYGKMIGIDCRQQPVSAWCRYTPTSRLGRFEVVCLADERIQRKLPQKIQSKGFVMASGKVYSGEFSNFEIRLDKMMNKCKVGGWILFNAWYNSKEEVFTVTMVEELDEPPIELGETKIGTAYRLEMELNSIMFDVFNSKTFGLVEDREGTYTSNLKYKHLSYFAKALYEAKKKKDIIHPDRPTIYQKEDDHKIVGMQFEEYIRWWCNAVHTYNWHCKDRNYHNLESWRYWEYTYETAFKPYFDLNTYYVWVIENPNPFGSQLTVCPWGHLPLDKIFKNEDYQIPKNLVEYLIYEQHYSEDLRLLRHVAPRNQDDIRRASISIVLNILDRANTSLGDYYLKHFAE